MGREKKKTKAVKEYSHIDLRTKKKLKQFTSPEGDTSSSITLSIPSSQPSYFTDELLYWKSLFSC